LSVPGQKAKQIAAEERNIRLNSYPRAYPFMMDKGKGTRA
jgi:hypothetical protein